jgi:hypothetical protein
LLLKKGRLFLLKKLKIKLDPLLWYLDLSFLGQKNWKIVIHYFSKKKTEDERIIEWNILFHENLLENHSFMEALKVEIEKNFI